MTSIPQQTAAITVDWLNEVLAPQGVGTIAAVRVSHMGDGVGILGEVARVHLTYESGQSGPATLVAKCQSLFAENIFIAQMMGFYSREVSFYNQLARTVSLRVPRCYYAECAEAGAPFILLIEEVTGARMIDQVVGATLAECEQIIDVAVALHSAFWEAPELYALTWLPPMNNDLYKGAVGLVVAKMGAFTSKWEGRLPADALAWADATTPRYADMVDWWVTRGNATLAHTDFRADNFLFGGSAGDGVVTLLDFQLLTRHVGVWDVSNFLSMSITTENRRDWERPLLERYHRGLVAAGVANYTFDRCWEDYRYCALQQAWAQIAVSDLDPGNDRGRTLLDSMITRSFQTASDLEAGEALERF
jgi:Phosphotransferase enzyme family